MRLAGFCFRQSKSGPVDQNPKAAPQTKMAGAYHPRARTHDVWGGGRGAAAGENSPDRNSEPDLRVLLSARVEAFRQRLRELGYVEGKNIVIEYRYAEGKGERLPDLAAELVRLKVDVIVTTGPGATLAAKKASATIPIVFAAAADPVGTGLVSSLAQPGGNITGLSLMVARSRWQTVGAAQGSLPQGCPGGLPLGIGWHEGKPGLSQRWRLRPRRWDSNFYRWRCEALTILRAHSHERKRNAPRRSLRPQVDLSILSNAKCWTSRQRTGCRRSTTTVSLLRPAA